jgi:hypothetical protein
MNMIQSVRPTIPDIISKLLFRNSFGLINPVRTNLSFINKGDNKMVPNTRKTPLHFNSFIVTALFICTRSSVTFFRYLAQYTRFFPNRQGNSHLFSHKGFFVSISLGAGYLSKGDCYGDAGACTPS